MNNVPTQLINDVRVCSRIHRVRVRPGAQSFVLTKQPFQRKTWVALEKFKVNGDTGGYGLHKKFLAKL